MSDKLASRVASIMKELKVINKKYGENTANYGDDIPKFAHRITTGSMMLDLALGGGLPAGRVAMFWGAESSGKSLLATKVAANMQRVCTVCYSFLEKYDIKTGEVRSGCACGNNRKGIVGYVDLEGTLDFEWAESVGLDTSSIIYCKPETGEEAVDIVELLIRTREVDLIVFDSVAAACPIEEIAKSSEDTIVGTGAKIMNRAWRIWNAAQNNVENETGMRPTIVAINQLRFKIGVMFGCMHADTMVPMADGRSFRIRDIVENKIEGDVFSINELTGKIETAKIIDWHYNGEICQPSDFLTIKAKGVETKNGIISVTCTRIHKLLVHDRGWIKAHELMIGDKIITKYTSIVNHSLKEFLLGKFVGDCSITYGDGSQNAQVRLQNSEQPEYLRWQLDMLEMLDFTPCYCSNQRMFWGSEFRYEFGLWKIKVGNRNPLSIFDEMTPLSFAVWYMDDGHYDCKGGHSRAVISVKRFKGNKRVLELIASAMTEKGYSCTPHIEQGRLTLTVDGFTALCVDICKYIPECMQYKLPVEYRNKYVEFDLGFRQEYGTGKSEVLSIEDGSLRKFRQKGKYDLSIEGNHNYLVGNKDNGVVVHNSPETRPGGNGQKFATSVEIKMNKCTHSQEKPKKDKTADSEDKNREAFPMITVHGRVNKNKTAKANKEFSFQVAVEDFTRNGLEFKKGEIIEIKEIAKLAQAYGLMGKTEDGKKYFYKDTLFDKQKDMFDATIYSPVGIEEVKHDLCEVLTYGKVRSTESQEDDTEDTTEG